ncbi:hypothetical protein [Parapedobacter sp. DT-150]|uniref:hypothetical protein n=1 Tax=Parapedobacter sp. DT-150 TaxID=3396162 RepID=UPI003F1C311D
MDAGKTYGIDISFEELKLPLHHDVLILAKNAAQGRRGLGKSLDLLTPGTFQTVDTNIGHERIAAVFINRNLLAKIPIERMMWVLQRHVFDHVADGELMQVDVKVRISINNING